MRSSRHPSDICSCDTNHVCRSCASRRQSGARRPKLTKENIPAAQKVLQEKAENNGLASLGKYAGTGESSERLFVANYSY